MRVALAVALLAAALAPASVARAYEDQAGLALAVGYSGTLSDTVLPAHGFAAQVEGSIGLGDTWEIRALGGYALHVDATLLHRAFLAAEVVYLVDILEVVPFLGLGIGAPFSFHDGIVEADFSAHGVVGLDWLVSRQWALGVEVRGHALIGRLVGLHGGDGPFWLTAVLRAQMLFEI